MAASTNPAADAPAWNRQTVLAGNLVGVSCATAFFCDAVGPTGGTVMSLDPASATPTWVPQGSPGGVLNGATAIACPSAGLCVFVDGSGQVFASTDPASMSGPTWIKTGPIAGPLEDLACPATTLCIGAAVDFKTTSSANAGAAAPVWTTPIDSGVDHLSCLSTAFCIGVGNGAVSTSTSPATTWSTPVPIDAAAGLTDVSCAPTQTVCVAVDVLGQVVHGVAAPENSALPTIAGTAEVGQTLTATAGTWSAAPALTHQWMRCDGGGSGCAAIAGATAATYAVTADDATHTLRVQETATNGGGTATVDSAATGVVPTPPGPGGGGGPGPGGTTPPGTTTPPATIDLNELKRRLRRALAPTGKAAKLANLRKRSGFTSSFASLSAGRLTITWSTVRKGKRKAVVVATGRASFTRIATAKPKVKLTAAGKKALRKAKRFTVTAKASFAITGGATVSVSRKLTLKR